MKNPLIDNVSCVEVGILRGFLRRNSESFFKRAVDRDSRLPASNFRFWRDEAHFASEVCNSISEDFRCNGSLVWDRVTLCEGWHIRVHLKTKRVAMCDRAIACCRKRLNIFGVQCIERSKVQSSRL